MRILFVGKREPQGRDLIERPYGRFHHIPAALAALGHEVASVLVGHRGLEDHIAQRNGVELIAIDARRNPVEVLRRIERFGAEWRPDWIIGVSDAWYGWIAHRVARRVGARLAVDAYDNYESYMPWNLPLHAAWRRALGAADVVTAAGPQLALLLQRRRNPGDAVTIVPMAADPIFVAIDQTAARKSLELDANARLVGYSGAWGQARGTDLLLEAFRRVRHQRPGTQLVLTGRPPPHALCEEGVVALGYLADAALPSALCALDVACVLTADTAFGRYSYPAKLCEAMACGIPVVATATAPVRWMLGDDQRHLTPVGDAEALAGRIVAMLDCPLSAYASRTGWTHSASLFNDALVSATTRLQLGG